MSHTTPRPCPCCGHITTRRLNDEYEPFAIQSGSDHHRVLKALRKKPRNADEVGAKIGRSPNEAAARLLELRRGGYVEYVIDARTKKLLTRTTSRGAEGRLQRLTPRGKATVAGL